MKKMNENTKVTLTLGQLKRLVKETTNDSDFEIRDDGSLVRYYGRGGNVVIPDGITKIDGAFYGCEGLISVKIPSSVVEIGVCTFKNCFNLTSVSIPEGVRSIDYCAFEGCHKLTSIHIPKSIRSISNDVFAGCPESIFDKTKNPTIKVLDGWVVDKTETPSGSLDLSSPHIRGIAGIFSVCEDLVSVTIGRNVKFISQGAFQYCPKLSEVKILNPALSRTVLKDPSFSFDNTPFAMQAASQGLKEVDRQKIIRIARAFDSCSGFCYDFANDIEYAKTKHFYDKWNEWTNNQYKQMNSVVSQLKSINSGFIKQETELFADAFKRMDRAFSWAKAALDTGADPDEEDSAAWRFHHYGEDALGYIKDMKEIITKLKEL